MYKLVATTKQVADFLHIGAKCEKTGLVVAHSISVKKSHKKLVSRLIDAINAGVVFTNLHQLDSARLGANVEVMGRYLSSDLTKLGF